MASQGLKSELFLWEGTNRQGKRVRGEMTGTSDALVKANLRRQGVSPLRVKKKPKPLFTLKQNKVTPKDIAVFSRQLATMISSGVPLVQAFDIIGRGNENPAMQSLLMDIRASVEAGGTLHEALGKHPRHFDALYVNLVRAGEQSGVLETLLHKIATYKEKTEALKSKVRGALFYPAAIIVVAFVITAILLVFVIPQFSSLFGSFGADLPALTKLVIALSEWFQEWWWSVLLGIGVAAFAFVETRKRSVRFGHLLDRLALKLPVVGDILYKSAVARFARTLSTMFAAGTPLVEAMASVAGACGNVVFYNACMKMREDIATGSQLQASMRDTALFPNMVTQMVAIGEESGTLDSMLSKVADWYEQEVDDAVDALTSLMEPIIMSVLGVLIGGLVVAMYLPIFKMGQVI